MAFGEVFVGALLQVLLEMLATGGMTQIMKYVKGKIIDPKTIEIFEENLRMIAALLQDAEQKSLKSAAFKRWVERLQDLAYDLDDVLDELATDAQLQLQQQGDDDDDSAESMARNITCLHSAKTKVKSILACGSRVVQRCHYSGGDLPSKIEEINNRLQQIHTQGEKLGLVGRITEPNIQYQLEGTNQIPDRKTTSLIDEPILFGREEKKNYVIRELLKAESGNGTYAVISIVGRGGIGKTTLAQFVYDDQQVKNHFDIKAWVCVSDVFDVTRITTDIIINSSENTNLEISNLEQAQVKLIEVIADPKPKRFLIVLDDIWNEKYADWSQLQKPFQYGATGSKIIVTTRDRKIATMVRMNRNHPIFNLESLSKEDCWRLFQRHANEDLNNDLVEMKDEIIHKCDGLPLAAKALGGLFRKTAEKSQRRMILNNNIWTEEGDVLPVLRLSYYHLPPHLKHTFAFCCILPKDYAFTEMEVILLWMVQGFLIQGEEDRFEDLGHLYFHDLVSRSLFERSPSKKNCYVMHDLVHDLAQWAASDICCCIMDKKDMQRELGRARHLYITPSDIDHHSWKAVEPIVAKLRTLICPAIFVNHLGIEFPEFLGRFRCMRTLILASETIEELPDCVGDLKHLRFLELRFTKIRVLPNSIRKLCNLLVLFLEDCWKLRELTNVRFLVKLRHLCFHRSLWEAMPREIGRLTELQSLGVIYLGVDNENGSMIRELRRLNQLHGKLSIMGLENVRKVEDALEAQLHEKKSLTKLYLKWGGNRDEMDDKSEGDVLEALKPHTGIAKLTLEGYMGKTMPAWLGDSCIRNIVSLKLLECQKCECLPGLGHLPSLKKLVVKGMNGIREVGPSVLGGLSCLKELRIERCGSLISVNEIPCTLAYLQIQQCPYLETVEFKKSLSAPSKVTIGIWIRECDSLVTVGRIPVTIRGLKVKWCVKFQHVLFGDMTLDSEEPARGTDGVSEKRNQNESWSPIELAHLVDLDISWCDSFRSLPEDLLCPSLKIAIFCFNEKQEALPEQLHTFTSLELLDIRDCHSMKRFPKGGLPKTMKSFIVHRTSIEEPPIGEWGIHLLPHLLDLSIVDIGSASTDMIECIPGPNLHLPSSLSRLVISHFETLKSINCASFPNLTELQMWSCPKLESLVDHSRPPNLKFVLIDNCPMIQQQCHPDPNGLQHSTYLRSSDTAYIRSNRVKGASSGT